MRAFTPVGETPVEGWPILLWFHGGEFSFSNLPPGNTMKRVDRDGGERKGGVDISLM